jgi:membrane-associated protease RseP (regulator of RpoE activity)
LGANPDAAEQGPPAAAPGKQTRLALLLLLLTLLTTTTLGGAWSVAAGADDLAWLSPTTVARVWGDPAALLAGFQFSIPLLLILLAHELGHYWTCRFHRIPVSPPYFLPAPWGLGTFGAFIRIRAPIRTKRELFDVGVSGPIAGFAVLAPFLLIGIARSVPVSMMVSESGTTSLVLGMSWAMRLAVAASHPGLAPEMGLDLHPYALAAWVGLLATSLNLLPLGQLDGGHIFYAAAGRWQWKLAPALWIALLAASWLWWVWALWALIVFAMGMRHPPVRDEGSPLGFPRLALAVVALLLFLLCFMPVPIALVPLA